MTRRSHIPLHEAFATARAAGGHAPSVLGSRPWIIGGGDRITLGADPDKRLDVADPLARELVLSCGAALYGIRVALRALGVRPEVRTLPDPDRPALLAEITSAGEADPGSTDRRLYAAIERRRTHRGLFERALSDGAVLRGLGDAAALEGAALRQVTDPDRVRSLSGLVTAAEHLHRVERPGTEEQDRWVRAQGDPRAEGVHAEDFPAPGAGAPVFPERDYGRGRVTGLREARGTEVGTVALLTTASDDRAAHLAAGQALHRVLLTAADAGYAAAFHTQPLEEPLLRAFITERFCAGEHPQMLLRLGRPAPEDRVDQGPDDLPGGVSGIA